MLKEYKFKEAELENIFLASCGDHYSLFRPLFLKQPVKQIYRFNAVIRGIQPRLKG